MGALLAMAVLLHDQPDPAHPWDRRCSSGYSSPDDGNEHEDRDE